MSNDVSVNQHIRTTTEIRIGRELSAHAWISIGNITLFMGNSEEETLYNIDRLTDTLATLRQQRLEQAEMINQASIAWKRSEASRM